MMKTNIAKRTWLELVPDTIKPKILVPFFALGPMLLSFAPPTHRHAYESHPLQAATFSLYIGWVLYFKKSPIGLVVAGSGGIGFLVSAILQGSVGYQVIFALACAGGLLSSLWQWKKLGIGLTSLIILIGIGVGYSACAARQQVADFSIIR